MMTTEDFVLYFLVGGTITLRDWRKMKPAERGDCISAKLIMDGDAKKISDAVAADPSPDPVPAIVRDDGGLVGQVT